MFKKRIAAAAFGTALLSASVLGTVAQDATPATSDNSPTTQQGQAPGTPPGQANKGQQQPIVQKGGAAGLIAAVVQVADTIDITDSNIEIVTIEVEKSLNNLEALNNVLNNSPILSENNIVITDVIEVGSPDDVIAIAVLEGGDLIIFSVGQ